MLFFCKKISKTLADLKIMRTFAPVFEKYLTEAQMARSSIG